MNDHDIQPSLGIGDVLGAFPLVSMRWQHCVEPPSASDQPHRPSAAVTPSRFQRFLATLTAVALFTVEGGGIAAGHAASTEMRRTYRGEEAHRIGIARDCKTRPGPPAAARMMTGRQATVPPHRPGDDHVLDTPSPEAPSRAERSSATASRRAGAIMDHPVPAITMVSSRRSTPVFDPENPPDAAPPALSTAESSPSSISSSSLSSSSLSESSFPLPVATPSTAAAVDTQQDESIPMTVPTRIRESERRESYLSTATVRRARSVWPLRVLLWLLTPFVVIVAHVRATFGQQVSRRRFVKTLLYTNVGLGIAMIPQIYKTPWMSLFYFSTALSSLSHPGRRLGSQIQLTFLQMAGGFFGCAVSAIAMASLAAYNRAHADHGQAGRVLLGLFLIVYPSFLLAKLRSRYPAVRPLVINFHLVLTVALFLNPTTQGFIPQPFISFTIAYRTA
ncbi:hypothetical protein CAUPRSCDRAFT_10588 [Caulochytrium protostelioides]|uniref:Uncharacterized protein n=1 Tax=Caulochytrium protostelioides TaxID=1555241 RepID=A0A4P9WYV3_9FUNG|nr:hypothetical protein CAUPRSCDRAFT_10588 [Caulochytrium protostelioides]